MLNTNEINNILSKPMCFAGIDVGCDELFIEIRDPNKPAELLTYTNTHADHLRMVKKLVKLPGIIVCLEATGVYHFDLAVALHDAGVSLMVVNPKSSHNFSKVLMKNSKTDAVDAHTLVEYDARMDFVPWKTNVMRQLNCVVFHEELTR